MHVRVSVEVLDVEAIASVKSRSINLEQGRVLLTTIYNSDYFIVFRILQVQ